MAAEAPKGGKVRVKRDTASPLWALVCAEPCGGDRCLLRGDHPGFLRPVPRELQGVCWLASSGSEEGARWIAEGRGWTVVP